MLVHIICWDGVEYDREATQEEIEEMRVKGYTKEPSGYEPIMFDFTKELKTIQKLTDY